MAEVSIVIPAFNEAEAIGHDLDVIIETMDESGYDYEIIVVDDGSTDNTGEIAAQKGARVIRHPVNMGSGAARKTGILQATGEKIVMTDADGTYPNHEIPRLLQHLREYDQVVGARTSEQGTMPWLRAPTKYFIRKLASFLTDMNIPDLNSGLRAFKKDIMLQFLYLLPQGFSCVSTMTLAFLSNGYTIKYLPIEYYKRKGQSKFRPIADTYNFILLVIRIVMYFNPLKIFLPVSLGLLGLGILKLILDFALGRGFKASDIVIILTAVVVGMMGLLADLIVIQHKPQHIRLPPSHSNSDES
jgi:glycosyltransferase involved in cell wall biosynthesis